MNLYVFVLGGSGVRVLHSLVMLLAAGMEIKSQRVVPVVIDTDVRNGNALETLNAVWNYRNIYKTVSRLNGQQSVSPKKACIDRSSVFTTEIAEPIQITVDGAVYGNLKAIVDENAAGIAQEVKNEIRLLYDNDNLEMPLTYGFIGNPSIGSIVLNYMFTHDDAFKTVVKEITADDKIFLVSSIFGGTGAAGFPLLLNLFNHSPKTQLNKQTCVMGAVSVTPYYEVNSLHETEVGDVLLDKKTTGTKKTYQVESKLFDSKTFAAQLYYADFIDRSIDVIYYTGDKNQRSEYKNCLGGKDQQNPAHVVELISALSIINFDRNINEKSKEGTLYSNLILKDEPVELTFRSIGDPLLKKALCRLWMFRRFFLDYLPKYLNMTKCPTFCQEINYTIDEYKRTGNQDLSPNLKEFLRKFETWTEELADQTVHRRRFSYVDQVAKATDDEIHFFFVDSNVKTKTCLLGNEKPVPSGFLDGLNAISHKSQPGLSDHNAGARLVRYASQIIDDIINTKMN